MLKKGVLPAEIGPNAGRALGAAAEKAGIMRAIAGYLSAGMAALALTACSAAGATNGAGDTVRIAGSAKVTCDAWIQRDTALGIESDPVRVYEGTAVTISDAKGEVIGSAQLGAERSEGVEMFCEFPWTAGVPNSEFYSVSISGLEWKGIPAAELQRKPVSLFGFYATSTGPTFKFER